MSKQIKNYHRIQTDNKIELKEKDRESENKSTQASRSCSICLDWSGSSCLPLSLLVAPGLGDTWSGFWGDRACFSTGFFTGAGGAALDLAFDLAEVALFASLIWSSDA